MPTPERCFSYDFLKASPAGAIKDDDDTVTSCALCVVHHVNCPKRSQQFMLNRALQHNTFYSLSSSAGAGIASLFLTLISPHAAAYYLNKPPEAPEAPHKATRRCPHTKPPPLNNSQTHSENKHTRLARALCYIVCVHRSMHYVLRSVQW